MLLAIESQSAHFADVLPASPHAAHVPAYVKTCVYQECRTHNFGSLAALLFAWSIPCTARLQPASSTEAIQNFLNRLSLTMPLAVLGDFFLGRPARAQVVFGALIVVSSFLALGLEEERKTEESALLPEDRIDQEAGRVHLEEEVLLSD